MFLQKNKPFFVLFGQQETDLYLISYVSFLKALVLVLMCTGEFLWYVLSRVLFLERLFQGPSIDSDLKSQFYSFSFFHYQLNQYLFQLVLMLWLMLELLLSPTRCRFGIFFFLQMDFTLYSLPSSYNIHILNLFGC